MSGGASFRQLAAAHWPLPAVCALFLIAGVLTLDDHGVTFNEPQQRAVGQAALDYLAGDGVRAFDQLANAHDRYYGAALEAPLVLAERILGLEDSRDIYLSRHILSHLFFLASGVCCYLLVFRLSNSRALALLATALFLLHPRIYAHSFFNSKDVPFLAMFMVSLYLTHRAFRRDTLAAFLLCGVGVGLLVNLRIMGVILFAAVLALRALDLVTASGAPERRRVLLTGGAFALTAALAYYASLPALWTDPIGQGAELARTLASHPFPSYNLFQGQWLHGPSGPPFDYLPVWIGITTPPAALLLAVIGALFLAWSGIHRPREALRNGPLRFGILILALPLVTAIAIAVLESNVYQSWRQLFFLYAPLLLLAAIGIHWLASLRGRWTRAGTYALAGVGVAVAVVSMVRIHPYQHGYFNALTDRTTSEGLASRYDEVLGDQSVWSVLTDIAGDHPSGELFVDIPHASRNSWLFPPHDRERITATSDFRSGGNNFYAFPGENNPYAFRGPCPGAPLSRVYASTLHCVVDPAVYFNDLRRKALATTPLERSRFDAHRVGDVMVYLRDGCSPDDTRTRFFLHVFPTDPADLPPRIPGGLRNRRGYAFERLDFDFRNIGVRIDGDCVAAVSLPDYPIASIHTGQYTPEHAEAVRRALSDAEPLIRTHFDIHLDPVTRTLTYIRDDCSAEDTAVRFFLHLFPEDAGTLPEHRRGHGFDNFNFSLETYGARAHGGGCAAAVPLPRYPIASVHTGQFSDRERLWTVGFAWPRGE